MIADPWDSLTYPLSVQELHRLSWLKAKIDAVEWLANHGQPVSFGHAKRLGFYRWLAQTGRMTS